MRRRNVVSGLDKYGWEEMTVTRGPMRIGGTIVFVSWDGI